MKRLCLFLPALLWSGLSLAGPDAGIPDQHAPPDATSGPTTPEERLVQAIGLYQKSEFEQAKLLLDQVLANPTVGGQSTRTALEAYLYLGFVRVAYGEKEAAQRAFQQALDVDAELTLPVRSPKVDAIFQQARGRFLARRRATDHDPPRLKHTPPGGGKYGTALAFSVQALDLSGVKRVILNYRLAGNRGFSSVNMEADGKGGYLATIPGMSVSRPGVEYYVAAWDKLNNGPGLKGSAGAPIRIKVKGGPLRKNDDQPRRWYQKWWVWATVAGVVAAAGGVALGVYLNRDEMGRIDARLPTDLDP